VFLFLALGARCDASTKEAQTLPLTAKSQIWSMTAIAASRSSAQAKRTSASGKRTARFWFCAMDSCGEQWARARRAVKANDADD
jgi:hypothetical protein